MDWRQNRNRKPLIFPFFRCFFPVHFPGNPFFVKLWIRLPKEVPGPLGPLAADLALSVESKAGPRGVQGGGDDLIREPTILLGEL